VTVSWTDYTGAVLGAPELTSADVATAAGVDLATARRLWRALGFSPVPDDQRFFTHADVDMLRTVQELETQGAVEPAVILQLARTTGQALARHAEAQVAAASDRLGRLGSTESLWPVTEALVPTFERFIVHVWRRHLLASVLRESASAAGVAETGRTLVVGFADLVGFTALSQQLDERELAALVDRFEALVFEHVPEHRGRVVKMIGDEAMFATEEAVDAAEIALALVDAHRAEASLPDLRVGLAMGPTLSWEGDLLGPTVNRASRVVGVARAATVLASSEVGEALRDHDGFAVRELRAIKLRGIGRVRLSVLRRKG
jgi:adenylate cyclase